jgi:signal transduction histidine kinase
VRLEQLAEENERLRQESERRRRVAKRLTELSRLISQSLDPSEVGRRIAYSVCQLLGTMTAVLLRAEPSGELRAVATAGDFGPGMSPEFILPPGAGVAGRAAKERRLVATTDLLADPAIVAPAAMRAAWEAMPHRASLAVPLLAGDRVVGVLAVGDRAGREFDEDETRLLQGFADHAATALRNAELFAEGEGRRREAEARLLQQRVLADLGQRALAGTSPLDLVQEAMRQALVVLAVDHVEVLELPEAGPGRRLAVGPGGEIATVEAAAPPPGSPAARALTQEAPVTVADYRADPGGAADPWLVDLGAASGISVLIRGRDRPYGVLGAHAGEPRAFTPGEVEFLSAVAAVLGTAVAKSQAEEALRRSEEQLRQAQKMDAVGRLAGGMAHDFNNLLAVIVGFSDVLIARLPEGDPRRADAEEIARAGDRAARLTSQLLAFSRRPVLESRLIDLNDLVSSVTAMLRRLIGQDVALAIRPKLAPAVIDADPGQIEQVVVNLVVNARDAMPAGGQLVMETEAEALDADFAARHPGVRPGPHVVLAVHDTGSGMSPEVQAHLFEPFFTTKAPGQGTGLGLATAYAIVRRHHGAITVESEPGQGSTFRIYLPQAEGSPEATAPRLPAGPPPRGTETVLLVEDEPSVRRLVRGVLNGCGYTVLEAADGADALRVAETHPGPIHLLLTDVVMPGMGGPELAGRLAARRAELRVLYISGYPDGGPGAALQPGAALLGKPFSPEALAVRVRAVLDV